MINNNKVWLKPLVWLMIFLSLLSCASLSAKSQAAAAENNWIRHALAQKLMVDFRYFCRDNSNNCRTPMTSLPPELSGFIRQHAVGGVILFAENIQSGHQVRRLNQELQSAAQVSFQPTPLYIAIDQEGGRVARLPRAEFPVFSGNMAIGATFAKHQTEYAYKVGNAIGEQLFSLGFNVNFAPSVDVNNNPRNPIINVRSFGDDPNQVGKLAQSYIKGLKQHNIVPAAKHFPGHGDTVVDSHSGLPKVKTAKQLLYKQELTPFKQLITAGFKDMVMTAHIQFPTLDDSLITTSSGKRIIKPATLSRKILTDLLRGELNYRGIIVSDALDMAAISQYFAPVEAIEMAFNAGVDIALMPMVLDSPKALQGFNTVLQKLEERVLAGAIDRAELYASYQRILAHKQTIKAAVPAVELSNNEIKYQYQYQLQQSLADDSLTLVKGQATLAKPIAEQKLLAVLPDSGKCKAFVHAFDSVSAEHKSTSAPAKVTCLSLLDVQQSQANVDALLSGFNTLVIGAIFPQQAVYEMVGAQTEERKSLRQIKTTTQTDIHRKLMVQAKIAGMNIKLVNLRMPFEPEGLHHISDDVLATYHYNVADTDGQLSSIAFVSLAKAMLGLFEPQGNLPIKVH